MALDSFGFWRSLFIGRYDDLWRSHLHRAFPGGNGRRREVADLLAPLLVFRNRIAHHEAVFALDLEKQHARFLELLRLMGSDGEQYVAGLSRVPELIATEP